MSDTVAQARALTGIGLAAWHRGRYDDARRFGERASGAQGARGVGIRVVQVLQCLGFLAHNRARFHEALQFFDRAEQAARDVADSAGIAKARGNRGLVYSDIGDFQRARDGIEAMRRHSHDAGNASLEGNA